MADAMVPIETRRPRQAQSADDVSTRGGVGVVGGPATWHYQHPRHRHVLRTFTRPLDDPSDGPGDGERGYRE